MYVYIYTHDTYPQSMGSTIPLDFSNSTPVLHCSGPLGPLAGAQRTEAAHWSAAAQGSGEGPPEARKAGLLPLNHPF